jgi:hypothetical protein
MKWFRKLFAPLVCLIKGHKPDKLEWRNWHYISHRHKGGKKHSHKCYNLWRTKHYRIICERCGKVLKKR